MADQNEGTRSLRETLDQIASDLTSNDPYRFEKAIIQASHYPPLYRLIEKNSLKIAQLRKSGLSGEFKEDLLKQLFGTEVEPLFVSTEGPDRPISEADISVRAKNLNSAWSTVDNVTARETQNREEILRKFTNDLVTKFALGDSNSLIGHLREIPLDTPPDELREVAGATLRQTLLESNIPPAPNQIEEAIKSGALTEFSQSSNDLDMLQKAAPLLIRQAKNIGDTNSLAQTIVTKIEQGKSSPLVSATYQAKAREALLLSAEAVKTLVGGAGPSEIFEKAGLVAAANVLTGEQTEKQPVEKQIAMVYSRLLESIANIEKKIDEGTLKIGGATSEQLKSIISQLNEEFSRAGGVEPGLASRFGAAFSAFSREIRGTDEMMTAYIQGVYQKILSPEEIKVLGFDRFLVAMVNVNSDSLYPTVDAAGKTTLNWLPDFINWKNPARPILSGADAAVGAGAFGGRLTGYFTGLVAFGGVRGFVGRTGLLLLRFFGFFAKLLAFIPGWIYFPLTLALPAIGKGISSLVGKLIGGDLTAAKYASQGILSAFGAKPTKSETNINLAIGCLGCLPIIVTFPLLFLFFGSDWGSKAAGLQVGGTGAGGPYPRADYIDFNSLGDFQCLANSATGISTYYGVSQPLNEAEVAKVGSTVESNPELALLNCPLQCSTRKIELTKFPFSHEGFGGYAPSAQPGHVIFWQPAFSYSSWSMARLIAHEFTHEINWFRKELFDAFVGGSVEYPRGYCGPLGTYVAGADETAEETFAEAAAMYIMGDTRLKSYCQGKTFEFMRRMFSQCKSP